MPDKLFSKVSVVPSELQSDIDLAKSMKRRWLTIQESARIRLIHRAKTSIRQMKRVASAFPEGSAVYTRYTVDVALLDRDMKSLFGPHWRCG